MILINEKKLLEILTNKEPLFVGIGTGTTPPQSTDTELERPVGERRPIASFEHVKPDHYFITGYFPHGGHGTYTIAESGLFLEDGVLLMRELLPEKERGYNWGETSTYTVYIHLVVEGKI